MGSSILLLEVLTNGFESLGTRMLLQCLLGDVVSLLIAGILYGLSQFLIVYLMAILALDVLAQFLRKLFLYTAHRLDGLVSGLEGSQQILL